MINRTPINWLKRWTVWLLRPTPWLLFVGIAALGLAIYMCGINSTYTDSVAVTFEIAGASLAAAQFVSLQNEFNAGWWSKEIRTWWALRPRKLSQVTANASGAFAQVTVSAVGSVQVHVEGGTPEEQLRLVWDRLGKADSTIARLKDDLKQQREEFDRQIAATQKAAVAASETVLKRLGRAITSEPLQAAVGLWLIVLGLCVQAYRALPPP